MNSYQIKVAVTAAGGAAAAFVEPVLPVAGLCTVMVVADVVSAVRLRRRLRRKGKAGVGAAFSSRGIGRAAKTLAVIYGCLCVAHAADVALGSAISFVTGGHSALNTVGTMIFLWQLMSVLENESSCSDSAWAGRLRRYLEDKTRRHFE